jgi:molybdopterin biosynthesis enzyme MoaB
MRGGGLIGAGWEGAAGGRAGAGAALSRAVATFSFRLSVVSLAGCSSAMILRMEARISSIEGS